MRASAYPPSSAEIAEGQRPNERGDAMLQLLSSEANACTDLCAARLLSQWVGSVSLFPPTFHCTQPDMSDRQDY